MSLSRRAFLGTAALAMAPELLKGSTREGPNATPDSSDPKLSPPVYDRFDPWVEVIPDNLVQGIRSVQRLSGGRPILAVVKNNAYGLDLQVVGRILDEEPGILGFAVVKGEEALKLRAAPTRKPILLMGLFSPEEGLELAEAGIVFSVFTADAEERILPLSRSLNRPVPVHFYLDTGMGRMGMSYREAPNWMVELGSRPEVRVQGTFTELTEDPEFDPEQIRRFLSVVERVREAGVETGQLHAAASNGVFHLPEAHLDLVRPGIALFGSYPSRPEEERDLAPLRSAVRLRTRVVRISHLRTGDGVGYGRPWTADRPTWVATLPVGHADGYPRQAVEGAQVLIGDETFPVIGGISASHCVIRIGDRPSVQIGDVATLMGPDHPSLEPNNLAQRLGVSVYDLLMHMNPKLPRVVVEE